MKYFIKRVTSSILILTFLIAACSTGAEFTEETFAIQKTESATETPSPTSTPIPTQNPTVTPTFTATKTATATSTATLVPTDTTTPTPTPEPTNTPVPIVVSNSGIEIYLVHMLGDGSDPCQANLVPVSTGLLASGDVKQDVTTAVNKLFSLGVKYSGNLYNPLYQSKLRVTDLDFNKSKKDITIYLTGSFTKPKNDCEKQLYRNQVWDTIRQFPEITRAHVWFGKYKLGDLLAVDY